MSSGFTLLAPKRYVSYDDKTAEVSIAASQRGLIAVSFRTAPGLDGYITSLRQAWDANLNTFVSWYLMVNKALVWPYQAPGDTNQSFVGSKVQIAPPEQDTDIPVPIYVGQLSLVEMWFDNSSGSQTGNVTGRVVVKYFNPNQ